jgi:hypothetical protein
MKNSLPRCNTFFLAAPFLPRSGYVIVEIIPIFTRFRSLGFALQAQKEKERGKCNEDGFSTIIKPLRGKVNGYKD